MDKKTMEYMKARVDKYEELEEKSKKLVHAITMYRKFDKVIDLRLSNYYNRYTVEITTESGKAALLKALEVEVSTLKKQMEEV